MKVNRLNQIIGIFHGNRKEIYMNANQARELSESYDKRKEEEELLHIRRLIKYSAERGKFSITYPHSISDKILEILKQDGYTVTLPSIYIPVGMDVPEHLRGYPTHQYIFNSDYTQPTYVDMIISW